MNEALNVQPFFDPETYSYSYVVADPAQREAAIIDPVLNYDPTSGQLCHQSMQSIIDYVHEQQLRVCWILETHVHADHLSAAHALRARLGGMTAISERVIEVQQVFGDLFNAGPEFHRDGSQFDRLLADNDKLPLGTKSIKALATPGHTSACMTYLIDDLAFVGDTLFMPDYGTARTDFPGGDARILYQSIQRILSLPAQTQLLLCHDYGTDRRTEFQHRTTVAAQRAQNIHVQRGIGEAEFVANRQCRDKALAAPRLLLPSVQFNMRAGQPPPPEANGQSYFKIPIREAN